jgi:hypothetical protein
MRRLVLFVLALLLSVAPLQAVAVGTATVTTANVRDGSTRYVRYRIAWLCNASGAVSGNPFSVSAGRIVSVRFTPNLAGTQPTDQYDVTVLDTDSVDVIFGAGATATATSYSRTMLPRESRTLAELFGGEYVGKIDGIWLSAPGTSGHTAARCTELEA